MATYDPDDLVHLVPYDDLLAGEPRQAAPVPKPEIRRPATMFGLSGSRKEKVERLLTGLIAGQKRWQDDPVNRDVSNRVHMEAWRKQCEFEEDLAALETGVVAHGGVRHSVEALCLNFGI